MYDGCTPKLSKFSSLLHAKSHCSVQSTDFRSVQDLHPQDFWDKHVSIKKPAVLRGHKNDEAAFKVWTDDYLRTTYADQHVRVELKQENRSFGAWRMTLPAFLDRYKKENIYAVTVLPEAMRHEVKVSSAL